MPLMKLLSSDGKIFEVDSNTAKCSVFIKVILEDLGLVELDGEGLTLSNVKSDILEKVIRWATHHQDGPLSTENHYIGKGKAFCIWDAEFLKENQDYLIDLMDAANYLDIKELYDLTCDAFVKSMGIRTKYNIREVFNIKKNMRKVRNKMKCVII